MEFHRDTFWAGRLTLWQPARRAGYRFNIDPVLLASFVPPGEHAVDLGAGCGILGILLLAARVVRRVTAVEVQPEMAELIERNVQANGLRAQMRVLCGDLRTVSVPQADRLVFNPPYFPANAGAPSPNPHRDIARREVHGTLADFVTVSAGALQAGGMAAAIVRYERGAELRQLAHAAGLAAVLQRNVLPRAGAAPLHVLTRMARDGQDTTAPAPLIVHAPMGRAFTPEVERWVSGF